MYYFLLEKKERVLVRERQEKDIWRHLNEFVLVETSRRLSPEKLLHGRTRQNFPGMARSQWLQAFPGNLNSS